MTVLLDWNTSLPEIEARDPNRPTHKGYSISIIIVLLYQYNSVY